jgi:hypothetical protein
MLLAIPQAKCAVCLSYTTPVVLYHTMSYVLAAAGQTLLEIGGFFGAVLPEA